MKKKAIVTLMVMLTLGACTPQTVTKGSYIRLVKETSGSDPVSPSSVLVFYKKQPDFAFTEIGIVEGIAIGRNAGLSDLLPELQRQAAAMGATAIHNIEIQRYNQTGDALHATGVAIIKK